MDEMISKEKFCGVCKILITTDTFNKDRAPYILATTINSYTQDQSESIQFDYRTIYDREDKYKDVVGFYHTHPSGCFGIGATDINTMKQWVNVLGKSLVCLIECDGIINAWLFAKNNNEINIIDIKANSTNGVNYYVWTEVTPSFWDNADFLLNGEDYYEEETLDPMSEVMERLDSLDSGLIAVLNGIEGLTSAIENLTNILDDENKIIE